MALDRPQDLAWIFVVMAIVFITFSYGLTSIQVNQSVTQNATFFYQAANYTESSTGLKGAADNQREALSGEDGSGDVPSEESFILRSYQAMKDLGKTWSIVESMIRQGFTSLGIPIVFVTLIASAILISFAVIMYTWLRGNR